MVLPKLKKCCGCLPLEAGVIYIVISLLACIAAISFCSWLLPNHRNQQNEDNIILLSMTMFSTLSAISNLVALAGVIMKRPPFLQLSILSNVVFILCILLVSVVTCLFSPALKQYLVYEDGAANAANIVLLLLLLISGGVYSLYYLTIVNSLYTKMKMNYGDSAIPV